MDLTYTRYLSIPELLDLQQARSEPPEHDELLFIVIHQVYELWFKLLLHELDKIKRDFSTDDMYGALATFKRSRTIMKTLVGQLDILETMTPMSFTSFRDRLETSSGFQSTQFRELEFVLGMKRRNVLKWIDKADPGAEKAMRRWSEPSLVDHFYEFLAHRGVELPAELRGRDVTEGNGPNQRVQEGVLRLYKQCPDLAVLFELMTDFDEGLQEWRYRHVKIVERTIGAKRGTGGSPGIDFLKETLFQPVFHDLWAIRHEL